MKRRLLTMVTALVLAAAGTALVLAYVRGADRRALAGKQAVEVLVAARSIPAGTPVDELSTGGFLRAERMPAETVPGDALNAIDEGLSGRVVGSVIGTGQLIRRPLLVAKSQSSGGFQVPDGKLAMTVALSDPQRVGGHVTAGSKVAVFTAFKIMNSNGQPKGEATGAKLLMSGIDVLSVGPASGGARNDTPALDNRSLVTLAVTQQEAEKLVWAAAARSGGGQDSSLYLGLQSATSVLSDGEQAITSFTLLK